MAEEKRVIDLTEDEPTEVSKFRFNAAQIGLTYSCPTGGPNPISTKEQILEVIGKVSPTIGLEQYIISVERHKNDEKHYHVYARYEKKLDIRNSRAWDVAGVHPNILKGTPKAAWKHYICKDGDYITNFYVKKVTKYSEALAASSVSEGLAIIAEHHPRDYLLQRDKVRSNLTEHLLAKRPRNERNLNPMSEYGVYVKSIVLDVWKTLAIVLHGETNLGKTCFARLLGEHPYLISHMDQLKSIPPETTHLVFDDMSFGHLPRSAILHLMDLEEDRAIHVRYTTATLNSGMPRVFTTNLINFLGYINEKDPSGALRQEDPAIERRLKWICIENKLY